MTYRTSPHATTNATPSSLFLGREIRTRFDLLKPDLESTVSTKQSTQVSHHDQHAKQRQFSLKEKAMVKNFRSGPTWVPGIIVAQLAPVTFLIEVQDGLKWKRHIDHIKSLGESTVIKPTEMSHTEDTIPNLTSLQVQQDILPTKGNSLIDTCKNFSADFSLIYKGRNVVIFNVSLMMCTVLALIIRKSKK